MAFKPLSVESGVLGRESDPDGFNGPQSAFTGHPNKSRSIHLPYGGIVRESIPLVPDEMDDFREGRL